MGNSFALINPTSIHPQTAQGWDGSDWVGWGQRAGFKAALKQQWSWLLLRKVEGRAVRDPVLAKNSSCGHSRLIHWELRERSVSPSLPLSLPTSTPTTASKGHPRFSNACLLLSSPAPTKDSAHDGIFDPKTLGKNHTVLSVAWNTFAKAVVSLLILTLMIKAGKARKMCRGSAVLSDPIA